MLDNIMNRYRNLITLIGVNRKKVIIKQTYFNNEKYFSCKIIKLKGIIKLNHYLENILRRVKILLMKIL